MEERLPYAASFGYYANIVQQIELIIYTNIQPSRQKFFPKVKVKGQIFKKMFCPIFYVKLLMSMEMTWLDFQPSIDSQNGRLIFFRLKFFFFTIHSSTVEEP